MKKTVLAAATVLTLGAAAWATSPGTGHTDVSANIGYSFYLITDSEAGGALVGGLAGGAAAYAGGEAGAKVGGFLGGIAGAAIGGLLGAA